MKENFINTKTPQPNNKDPLKNDEVEDEIEEETSAEIEIKSGETITESIIINKGSGSFNIETDPPGADIFIDDKKSGAVTGRSRGYQQEPITLFPILSKCQSLNLISTYREGDVLLQIIQIFHMHYN